MSGREALVVVVSLVVAGSDVVVLEALKCADAKTVGRKATWSVHRFSLEQPSHASRNLCSRHQDLHNNEHVD